MKKLYTLEGRGLNSSHFKLEQAKRYYGRFGLRLRGPNLPENVIVYTSDFAYFSCNVRIWGHCFNTSSSEDHRLEYK
ncbi:hypothetical protein BLOT_009851 [Blomia tropicalis]|nr:hypothetical protein BLOT_015665 [Blomia tropicalis]KAI2802402.1 hypothetical protein BLOT_009851 [Blomia tropicalis]